MDRLRPLFLSDDGAADASTETTFYQRLFAVNAFGFIFLLLSFRFGGHVSVQSLSVQFAQRHTLRCLLSGLVRCIHF